MLTLLTASVPGVLLGSPRDGAAYYGDPRFFNQQAPSQILHNVPGDDLLVTSAGSASALHHQQVALAITAWNNALQSSPNSLSKYALHYSGTYDPNANVVVEFVEHAEIDEHCTIGGRVAPACNDGTTLPVTIYVDKTQSTTLLVTHELGHPLQFTDQYYYPSGTCSPAVTVMDCEGIQENTDEVDFRARYRPQLQSANATYPDTWSATWTVYYGGEVKLFSAASQVEYLYYWDKYSDSNGIVVDTDTTPANDRDLHFGYVVGTRYCVATLLYNEVGYAAGSGGAWSPRSQFSCIGAAQDQDAGFLLATSDRNNPLSNNLYLRVRNLSGGTRNVAIFGPNFADIGCGFQNLSNGSTRLCYISLARGAYSELTWFAFPPSGDPSWGYLDFE
jgi:hypothetical protein